jgi:hypothetical protein
MQRGVLGATEDKAAFDVLHDRALHDADLRVRVSADSALGQLNDARASAPLLARGQRLTSAANAAAGQNEVFEWPRLWEELISRTRRLKLSC